MTATPTPGSLPRYCPSWSLTPPQTSCIVITLRNTASDADLPDAIGTVDSACRVAHSFLDMRPSAMLPTKSARHAAQEDL